MNYRQSLDELANRFPASFVWGVASSAFQIEGASTADGKGASIWDEFCRLPGVIADGSDGRIACDHYNRLESDLDLIAGLGVGAYRFSISWPRIQPTGSGEVLGPGIDFYNRLVDGLLERGIEPFATLYHWDLPATLQREHNGWADRNTAYRFAEYAALVADRLGDRVRSFATHNEPWVTATIGHEMGHFAPGIKDRAVAMQVSHHCLLSHGLAMQAMRSTRSNLDVGIVLNLSPVYSATDSSADRILASREDGLLVRWYMDALLRGEYPQDILEYLAADAPRVQDGDAQLIAEPLGFLGVNYYNPIVSIAGRPFSPAREGVPVTDMGWEVAPAKFTDLLLRLDRDYDLPPLFITENGAAYPDLVIDGGVRDEDRRAYIETHIRAIADAIDQGVDVRGYFVWSLLDNFEWAAGYTKRFGIYYVDYQTQARILKRSGFWYKDLAAAFHRTQGGRVANEGSGGAR
ncbi:MAG TPA: GH1 family beta-glucosidase [Steroidobacteraceae bacterium]|nr:GH1 family beta-glucosidase [Steroidobacteraceae bacterium]